MSILNGKKSVIGWIVYTVNLKKSCIIKLKPIYTIYVTRKPPGNPGTREHSFETSWLPTVGISLIIIIDSKGHKGCD